MIARSTSGEGSGLELEVPFFCLHFEVPMPAKLWVTRVNPKSDCLAALSTLVTTLRPARGCHDDAGASHGHGSWFSQVPGALSLVRCGENFERSQYQKRFNRGSSGESYREPRCESTPGRKVESASRAVETSGDVVEAAVCCESQAIALRKSFQRDAC